MAIDRRAFLPAKGLSSTSPSSESPNSSPTDSFDYPDLFDEARLADAYSVQPIYPLDERLVFDYWNRPISTAEVPAPPVNTPTVFTQNSLFSSEAPESLTPHLFKHPKTLNLCQTAAALCPRASSFAPILALDSNDSKSAASTLSATPSLPDCCTMSYRFDPEQQTLSPEVNDALSNRPLAKRALPTEAAEGNPGTKRIPRKRGRPRLQRNDFGGSNSSTNPRFPHSPNEVRVSHRLPHNLVERKYREGLNLELERLRRAIPTLLQRDPAELTGPPRPTKAIVLASAIDYIKYVEAECDRLFNENELLRSPPSSSRGRTGKRSKGKFSSMR